MFKWGPAKPTKRQGAAEFIFKNSPDAFFVLRDGRIAECNPATAHMIKLPLDQVVGMSPPQFSPELQPCGRSSNDLAGEMIARALEKGQHSFEWTIKCADGSPLLVRVTLIAGELDGAPVLCVTWQDMAETHALRETERQLKAQQDAIAAAHADALGRLAQGLQGLSGGDLTYRLDGAFAAESDTIRVDFNDAATKLRGAMESVAAAVTTLRSGANEIAAASSDLSRRTEQQAASLEETAAALDEITATVKQTAEGAQQAQQVVSTAKTSAEHSGKVVSQAVQAMTAIEQSSKRVNQIIGVIDEIAFQTNLLALNAGVEAARAGEAGRGFAVVASEVRALAQRSAEAAKEIKALISASGRQVEQGVALVHETGKSLGHIVAHVAEINGIVSAIAMSAHEQSVGLDQVNTAMNQMDQITQQNAAMVEESTAASRNLATETEELTRLIGQFQVGAGLVVVRNRIPQRKRPMSQPIQAMKAVGGGGAVLKPALQDASWEEF